MSQAEAHYSSSATASTPGHSEYAGVRPYNVDLYDVGAIFWRGQTSPTEFQPAFPPSSEQKGGVWIKTDSGELIPENKYMDQVRKEAASGVKGNQATPDWNARIGNYTYDQAVAEFGEPTKSTKANGNLFAEWPSPGRTSVKLLELSFGPDGKLLSFALSYR
jgi:hypothetical protein